MERLGKRKKLKTVTFRIEEDVIDQLYDESDTKYISLNSLVNSILKRHVQWNKFDDKSNMIPIASEVLKELVAINDKDQITKLAKGIAKDAVYNIILFMYGKVDFDILLSWYLERMKHCSEISDKKDNNNGNRRIIFKHELGMNWSLYHKTILESVCHDILSVPMKIDITSSTIKLDI